MSLFDWISAISVLMQVPSASTVETYGSFAAATPGNSVRGKAIFHRESIACASCHTIGDGSLRACPDLLGIGDKYPRKELIRAVLEPSASILTGYAATTLVSEAGKAYTGIVVRRGPWYNKPICDCTTQAIRDLAFGETRRWPRREIVLSDAG